MTPQQHLMHAENLLNVAAAAKGDQGGPWVMSNIMAAMAHILMAQAAEAGVPHPVNPLEGGDPGAQPLDPRL